MLFLAFDLASCQDDANVDVKGEKAPRGRVRVAPLIPTTSLHVTDHFFPWTTYYCPAHLRFGSACRRVGMPAKQKSFVPRFFSHA